MGQPLHGLGALAGLGDTNVSGAQEIPTRLQEFGGGEGKDWATCGAHGVRSGYRGEVTRAHAGQNERATADEGRKIRALQGLSEDLA